MKIAPAARLTLNYSTEVYYYCLYIILDSQNYYIHIISFNLGAIFIRNVFSMLKVSLIKLLKKILINLA